MLKHHLSWMTLAGYRPRTIQSRREVVTMFISYLSPRDWREAHHLDVIDFLARPLAPQSRRAYRAHLRGFYAWAIEEGLVHTDPTAKVPPVRTPRGTPRPIGPDALALALERADLRMRSWLLLMALGGLRACEVAQLHPTDVLTTEGVTLLYLRETKGGGTATVPAHPAVVDALAVLPVHDGAWWSVTASHVSKMVARHLRACGIDATGHQLRHYAGTEWYRVSGHDLLTTARLLRHATVDTTQVYAQLDPTRPQAVVGQVPLPRLPSAS